MMRWLKYILAAVFPVLLFSAPVCGQGQSFSYGFGLARDYPGRMQAPQLDQFFSGYMHADYFPTDHLPFGLTFKFSGGKHTNFLQRINDDTINKASSDVIVRGSMRRYSAGIKLAFHESEFTWNPYFSPKLTLVHTVSRLKLTSYDGKDTTANATSFQEKMHDASALLYGFEAGIVFTPLVQLQKLRNRRCFFSFLFSAEYQRSFGSFEYQTLGGDVVNKNSPADFEFIKDEYRKNAVLNSGQFATWQFNAGILIKIRFLPV